jgi:hypothetical protein
MARTFMNAAAWAVREFGGATLGDRRRGPRLVRVAQALAEEAHGTLPGSFGRGAEVKAAYRLLEERDVTYERIIAPHLQRVRAACGAAGEYLLVEDTTSLDFTSHGAAQDLGRIGDDGGRGLWVHSTLALRVESWTAAQAPEVTVVGLVAQQWWARTCPTIGSTRESKKKRLSRPRESQRWASACAVVGRPPVGASWTYLADRESDIYEVFGRCAESGWRFIIRAEQARALADEGGSVFAAVAESPELGRFFVELRARPGQAARRAELAVRSRPVTLRGPWRPGGVLSPCTVNVVEASEPEPPAGVEPLHWVLLTDWPCSDLSAALRVVKTYRRRWLIEEYHKSLKTGTGIEQSQLTTAQRITSLLGVLAVVAVRLLSLKLLSSTRAEERVSAVEELGPAATAILEGLSGRPSQGWTAGTLLVAIARLGGFMGRKGDGSPGWQTLWRGWKKLMLMVQGFDLARGPNCG